jgi:hypothetical protein
MIISLNIINQLIVTVETGGVVCELGTEVFFFFWVGGGNLDGCHSLKF